MEVGRMRQRGFTLLEILAALTVFGFLLAGLSQGLDFGLRIWGRELRAAGTDDHLVTLDLTLRRLIEGMDPGDDLEPSPLSGSRNQLNCLSVLSSAGGPLPGQRMRAVLLVRPDRRLVLRWQPSPRATLIGRPPPPAETELLIGVASVELAYMRQGGVWQAAWRSADLPSLVRVRVKFPPGDLRNWPDIVAAPVRDRP